MMKAAVFEKQNDNLIIKQIPIVEPLNNEIRIKVIACGVCSGDHLVQLNSFNCTIYPKICGHEVIGIVDKIGVDLLNDNNFKFKLNDMVGVGWFGGYNCDECYDCLNGYSNLCNQKKITGMQIDGGYAEYIKCHKNAIVKIPNGMDPIKCAPLLCAGVTIYNSLKQLKLKQGSLIAILGIGGLGHLGILYAKAMGYNVIAISRDEKKKDISFKLGADHYIQLNNNNNNNNNNDYINEIKSIGRVESIIVTSPSSELIEPMLQSLCNNGKLLLLSILDKGLIANTATIVNGNKSIIGWSTGDTSSLYESLQFAQNNNIEPIINQFTLDNVQHAFNSINNSKFRNVIIINEIQ